MLNATAHNAHEICLSMLLHMLARYISLRYVKLYVGTFFSMIARGIGQLAHFVLLVHCVVCCVLCVVCVCCVLCGVWCVLCVVCCVLCVCVVCCVVCGVCCVLCVVCCVLCVVCCVCVCVLCAGLNHLPAVQCWSDMHSHKVMYTLIVK